MGIATESVHSGNSKCAYEARKFYGLESRSVSDYATDQDLEASERISGPRPASMQNI
jgi:hypothetical protein